MAGIIYLIPVTLGDRDYLKVIPSKVIETSVNLRFFAVEDLRSARRYLRLLDKNFPIDDTTFFELNEHTKEDEIRLMLEPVLRGQDLGIMSEAGLPGIADPGSLLVRAAHLLKIRIMPLTGPSSIILALISSGMNGQSFAFHGYLPIKSPDRIARLKELERRAETGETQIFMETPYRNQKLFESILSALSQDSLLCIAADISMPTEEIRSMRIAEWKTESISLNDRPAIFLLSR